ncbi:hypothetical protein Hanom_Chr12g01173371 [Helianthus anomalus]
MKYSNNPLFSPKLFMHTLSMTLLIIIMVTSFQAMALEPAVQAPDPEFSFEPEPLMFDPDDEILDYGDWFGPPNTGGTPDSGPIPHPEVDDEVVDIYFDDTDLID